MLQMSFYNGTLDRTKAKQVVESTDTILKYRLGFAYRGAQAVPIEKEKALHIIENESCLDVDETDTEIVLNAYTSNDML